LIHARSAKRIASRGGGNAAYGDRISTGLIINIESAGSDIYSLYHALVDHDAKGDDGALESCSQRALACPRGRVSGSPGG
jgi:hypothetical protein